MDRMFLLLINLRTIGYNVWIYSLKLRDTQKRDADAGVASESEKISDRSLPGKGNGKSPLCFRPSTKLPLWTMEMV